MHFASHAFCQQQQLHGLPGRRHSPGQQSHDTSAFHELLVRTIGSVSPNCLQVHDIEDLCSYGRANKACPYYASRKMADVSKGSHAWLAECALLRPCMVDWVHAYAPDLILCSVRSEHVTGLVPSTIYSMLHPCAGCGAGVWALLLPAGPCDPACHGHQ